MKYPKVLIVGVSKIRIEICEALCEAKFKIGWETLAHELVLSPMLDDRNSKNKIKQRHTTSRKV